MTQYALRSRGKTTHPMSLISSYETWLAQGTRKRVTTASVYQPSGPFCDCSPLVGVAPMGRISLQYADALKGNIETNVLSGLLWITWCGKWTVRMSRYLGLYRDETNFSIEGGSITQNFPGLFKCTLGILDRSILAERCFFLTVEGREPTRYSGSGTRS